MEDYSGMRKHAIRKILFRYYSVEVGLQGGIRAMHILLRPAKFLERLLM